VQAGTVVADEAVRPVREGGAHGANSDAFCTESHSVRGQHSMGFAGLAVLVNSCPLCTARGTGRNSVLMLLASLCANKRDSGEHPVLG